MKSEEYVTSLVINGKLVNIGVDDYGQCYFLQYYNEDSKEIEEIGLGTYNEDYEEEAKAFLRTDTQRMWDSLMWQRDEIRSLAREVAELKEKLNETS